MMTEDDLEKLLNGPEWVLPLMQDIAAGNVTREQVNAIFDYMAEQKFKDKLARAIHDGKL